MNLSDTEGFFKTKILLSLISSQSIARTQLAEVVLFLSSEEQVTLGNNNEPQLPIWYFNFSEFDILVYVSPPPEAKVGD